VLIKFTNSRLQKIIVSGKPKESSQVYPFLLCWLFFFNALSLMQTWLPCFHWQGVITGMPPKETVSVLASTPTNRKTILFLIIQPKKQGMNSQSL
jgi:hypothetical protein